MSLVRPYVLSIAGFDPSAGAGVLADIKTFEGAHVYGLGISTAIAIQTDEEFVECRWEKLEVIQQQITLLFNRFSPKVVKIGIVPSLPFLNSMIDTIFSCDTEVRIIWDSVYTSSTGFQFIEENWTDRELYSILKRIYLLTPNVQEASVLANEKEAITAAKKLSEYCHVLLKGGHSNLSSSTDILFSQGNEKHFAQERLQNISKHGSGCVLSSAIAAYVAKGESLESACALAKKYIHVFLKSSNSLLGYHVG